MTISSRKTVVQRETALFQIEEGKRFRVSNDLTRAKRCFRIATKLDPDNEQAWSELATVLTGAEQDQCFQRVQNIRQSHREAQGTRLDRWLKAQPKIALAALSVGLAMNIVLAAMVFAYFFFLDRSVGGLYWAGENTGAQMIQAKEGGQLNLKGVSFTIPSGSLLNDASFSMKTLLQMPPSQRDPSLVAVGLPVQIETDSTYLRSPAWMALRYDRERLPAGVPESSLQLARWDGNHWVFLDSAIDKEKQQIHAQVTHFSSPVIQLFGRSARSRSALAIDAAKADQLLEANDLENACQAYTTIIEQYGGEQPKGFQRTDESIYWMAYYHLGLCMYRSGQYAEAGELFYALLRDSYTIRQDLINQDGSGPALALTALQNWYPLGVHTSSSLHAEQLLQPVPSEVYSIVTEKSVYRSAVPAAYDTLPVEIRAYLKGYEEQYGGKDSIVTDSSVDVLMVSSQSQVTGEQFQDVYTREIKPILEDTFVRNEGVSRSTENFRQNLSSYVAQYLDVGAATNAYLIDPSVAEDPTQRAPLLLLRIQRKWQGERRYYGQYLLALAPSDLKVGRRLDPTRFLDRGLRYVSGRLSGVDISYNWFVFADYVTDDTGDLQADSKPIQATMVSAGGSHTCALSGGGVLCWGSNKYWQLGSEIAGETFSAYPRPVSGLTANVKAVVAGSEHTCALTNQGAVKCWGRNDSGQLGDESNASHATPAEVTGLASGMVAISTGQNHTCALHQNGRVWCWGSNFNGQLGNNGLEKASNRPVRVENLDQVAAIAAGGNHTCALKQDGSMVCWGANARGQLGARLDGDQPRPVEVQGLSGIEQIGAGFEHTCARAAGLIFCWGSNAAGQLGTSTVERQTTPTTVSGLDGKVMKMSVGYNHTCALLENSQVRCWGTNANGQLGVSLETTNSLRPVAVEGLAGPASAVTAGGRHTCAMLKNGDIQCWGGNEVGQLGGSIAEKIAGVVSVIGFGGRGPNDPLGEIVVEPVAGNNIELGQVVTVSARGVKAVGLQNTIKDLSFFVSVNGGEWQKISGITPTGEDSQVTWETEGKALDAGVSFKIEITDQFGNKTVRASSDYALKDTQKPISGTVRVVMQSNGQSPESNGSQIEMGDWVMVLAENVEDNPKGSGIRQVTFKVIENDQLLEMITTRTAPYTAYWPVPKDLQKNWKDRVQFVAEVADFAMNQAEFRSGVYTLIDTQNPQADSDLTVTPVAGCSKGPSCIEYGETVTITASGVADNTLGSGVQNVTLQVLEGETVLSQQAQESSGGSVSFTWNSKDIEYTKDGRNVSFKVIVTDKAGNKNLNEVRSNIYPVFDSKAPVCDSVTIAKNTADEPTVLLNGKDSVTFTVTPNVDSGSKLSYAYDTGSGWNTPIADNPYTWQASFGTEVTGAVFKAKVVDMEGNEVECSQTKTFHLDLLRPVVTSVTLGPLHELHSDTAEKGIIEIVFSEPVKEVNGAWLTITANTTKMTSAWSSDQRSYTIQPDANGWIGGDTIQLRYNPSLIIDLQDAKATLDNSKLSGNMSTTVTNALAYLTTNGLVINPGGTLTIAFNEPVFTSDKPWAALSAGNCPPGVTLTVPAPAGPSQQLQLTLNNYNKKLFGSCAVEIYPNQIFDHDNGEQLSGSPDPKLLYFTPTVELTSVDSTWDTFVLSFSGPVNAAAGWAAWPSGSPCAGMGLTADPGNGLSTLTIVIDPRNVTDAQSCTIRIDPALLSESQLPNAVPIGLHDLLWDFAARVTFSQAGTIQAGTSLPVSFNPAATVMTFAGGWASLQEADCSAATISAPAGSNVITVSNLQAVADSGTTLTACTVVLDFSKIQEEVRGLSPVGGNTFSITLPPPTPLAEVASSLQTATGATVTFTKNVTTDANWATLDAGCTAAGITLAAPASATESTTNSISVDIGTVRSDTIPTCTITLVPARIHDADRPAVLLSWTYSFFFTVPAP